MLPLAIFIEATLGGMHSIIHTSCEESGEAEHHFIASKLSIIKTPLWIDKINNAFTKNG